MDKKNFVAENAITEFQRLFAIARKGHRKAKDKATAQDPAHQSALLYGREHRLAGAETLLQASLLDWQGDSQSALTLLETPLTKAHRNLEGLQWYLKGFSLNNIGQYNAAIDACRKALDSPEYDTPGNAWSSIGFSYGKKEEYAAAIDAYRKALDSPEYDRPGDAWNNIGVSYGKKGEHDAAIDAYRKALDFPEYDTPGDAWNNIGIAYYNKGEHDAAIDAYRKALDFPNYGTPGDTWHNIGITYDNKGEHDAAIDAYRKALDFPNYDTPGDTWNNIGIVYYNKGEHDAAIDAYRKALDSPNYDTPGDAWNNLGIIYYKTDRYSEARDSLQKALASYDANDVNYAVANSLLQLVESESNPKFLNYDDRALLEPTKVNDSQQSKLEARISGKLQSARQSQYDKYLEKPSSERESTFSVLRGWSSAVTLLEGSERLWRGGGYLLKWKDKGIVIDPGLDFLRNLHDAGYHGREIDAVLVSHNHPDHNSDLASIDDLCYEIHRRLKKTEPEERSAYTLILDRDSQSHHKFTTEKAGHRYLSIVFDRGRCDPEDIIPKPHSLPFSVTCFEVEHSDDVPNAVGFRLTLHDGIKDVFTLGYTGDTQLFPGLADRLKGCDLLLAHISQPDYEEFTDPNHRKKIHLGYRGLAELIKSTQPKLTLVGEFWAGLADVRIDLVQGLRGLSNTEAILPAGIGLHLKLPEMQIECSECKQPTLFSKIRVAPPANRFENLAYLCEHCLLV